MKIMNIAYLDKPCERCGSKRMIGRTWTETVQNFSGTVEVKHQQIVCSNEECQSKFEKGYQDEAKRKEELRVKKEAYDTARKANRTTSPKNKDFTS